MKKFVLVMISALLMVVFIAFNYLLWDRENKEKNIETLENSNASNNASINALGREISMLEEKNKSLESQAGELEERNKALTDSKDQLARDNVENTRLIEQQAAVIDNLKRNVDIKLLEAPVKKWMEDLDTAKYDEAYKLQRSEFNAEAGFTGYLDFEAILKKEIKNIKYKSAELVVDGLPEVKKNSVVLKVSFDVKLAEDRGKPRLGFAEGHNERVFTLDYDAIEKDWYLSAMSQEP